MRSSARNPAAFRTPRVHSGECSSLDMNAAAAHQSYVVCSETLPSRGAIAMHFAIRGTTRDGGGGRQAPCRARVGSKL